MAKLKLHFSKQYTHYTISFFNHLLHQSISNVLYNHDITQSLKSSINEQPISIASSLIQLTMSCIYKSVLMKGPGLTGLQISICKDPKKSCIIHMIPYYT